MECFILNIVKKIESLRDGVLSYAYKAENSDGTNKRWEVVCSDLDMYLNDKRFDALRRAWGKAAKARGQKIIFIGRNPNEKILNDLLEEDNLIMNT